ncbi:sulfotransferase family 2 domain-containing protein [Chryseobacterium sp.]|uniref:sulfotransferase family 2 domain-containing protein n=1 Tax=Chryseobacterium sp. TaxID=1871047 RepID=UPI00333E5F96
MNTKLPLIFLHFPRTGGYTFHDILKQCFSSENVYSIYGTKEGVVPKYYEDAFLQKSEQEKKMYKYIHGHAHFGLHEFYNEYTYYTLLRNPIKRIISMYGVALKDKSHYLHDIILQNKFTLSDLLYKDVTPEFNNGMTRMLGKRQNGICSEEMFNQALYNFEHYFPVFGITERFLESVALMNIAYGSKVRFFHKQLNTKMTDLSHLMEDKDLIDLIMEKNKYDIKLYEYGVAKFEDLIHQNILKLEKELDCIEKLQSKINWLNKGKLSKKLIPFYMKIYNR